MIIIKNQTKCHQVFWEALRVTWFEFVERTTIHGLRYIIDERGNKFTRALWLVVTIIGFIASNVLVDTFWLRYKDNPTRLKIDSFHKPLNILDLPAVTICQVNHMDVERAHNFVNQLILPSNVSRTEILKYLAHGSSWSGVTSHLTYDNDEMNVLQNVLDENNVSMEETLESIRQPCSDLLFRCRFEFQMYPCTHLFVESMSYLGMCCTFNRFLHTPYFERLGGLSIVLKLKNTSSSYSTAYSKGVKLLIHQSTVFPSDLSVVKMLSHQSENILRIESRVTKCSADVKSLTIDERECIFPWEKNLRVFNRYTENNCDVECRMIQIIRLCGCLPYNYRSSTKGRFPVCNFTKIDCLMAKYFQIYESRMYQQETCQCPPDCNSVSFDASLAKLPLVISNFTVDPFYDELNISHMVAHIVFGKQVFKEMRRDLLINIITLASGLGGIYSLFIGMGVLTFFEIFYFATFRFKSNYMQIKQQRDLVRVNTRKIFVRELRRNYYRNKITTRGTQQ